MHKLIRHAKSMKDHRVGQARGLTSDGIAEAIAYGKALDQPYRIIASPKPRAIITGGYINVGRGSSFEVYRTDPRIDIAHFQEGYTPGDIGGVAAAHHIIENDKVELGRLAKVIAKHMVATLRLPETKGVTEDIIAVGHETPITLFLYAMNNGTDVTRTQDELTGFSYSAKDGNVILTPDRGDEITLERRYLEDLASGKEQLQH